MNALGPSSSHFGGRYLSKFGFERLIETVQGKPQFFVEWTLNLNPKPSNPKPLSPKPKALNP